MNGREGGPVWPEPMKHGVRKQHRAKGIVVRIEWSEPLKVRLRDRIRQNHAAVARDDERLGSIGCRMRNGVQQDDQVLLLGYIERANHLLHGSANYALASAAGVCEAAASGAAV